jgi:hypothetical protein
MGALADIDTSLVLEGVGVFLAGKGLDAIDAVLVDVLDDPGLTLFAALCCPFPLANRHCCYLLGRRLAGRCSLM